MASKKIIKRNLSRKSYFACCINYQNGDHLCDTLTSAQISEVAQYDYVSYIEVIGEILY